MTWSSFIGSTLVCCSATFHFLIGQLGRWVSLQSSQDWFKLVSWEGGVLLGGSRARARALLWDEKVNEKG